MTNKMGIWWETMLGLLYLATGGYMMLQPSASLSMFTLLLAAWLFIEALLEFVLAFYLRAVKGSGWLLLDGIITLALGLPSDGLVQ